MRPSHLFCAAIFAGICGVLATPARAINIVPNFVSNVNGTWNATQMTVVQDAINDWNSHVTTNQTFTVTFDFVHGGIGTYLAQWHASYTNIPNGTNIYAWTNGVTHTEYAYVELSTVWEIAPLAKLRRLALVPEVRKCAIGLGPPPLRRSA